VTDPTTLVMTSADETRAFGRHLGAALRPGAVVLLSGDLGAGKTTLAQGIATGLGVTDHVQSPTFTLVAEYAGRTGDGTSITLYHLDLYRLSGESDLESFGFDQYLDPVDGVTLIEWPERAGTWLPEAFGLIELEWAGTERRLVRLSTVPNGAPTFERFLGWS